MVEKLIKGIPDDWIVNRIGSLCKVIRGASPRPKGDKRFYGGDVPRLMVEDVTRSGKFVTPMVDFLTKEGEKRSRPCKKGTLTIVCSGTVGIPSFLAVDACIHDGFLALINIKKNIDDDYLYHQLSSLRTKFESSATHGGIFTNLTTTIMEEFLVPYPSKKEEQTAIARLLSDADELIIQLESIIEKKKNIKKGVMYKLLTMGIGHTKFKKITGRFQNQFEIPEEWDYVQIGKLVKENKILEIQDGNHGELHPKTSDFVEIGIPFITADCLIRNKIDYDKCKSLPEKFLEILRIGFAKKDDVLLSHKGSIGNIAIVGNEFQILVLSPQTTYYRVSDDIIPLFLYYIFQSEDFQKQIKYLAKQSTRDFVGITNQQQLFIPYVPSRSEQQKIASILFDIDAEIEELEKERDKHIMIKKGMMQKLLTGEIRLQ